jgi:hypothetical protein
MSQPVEITCPGGSMERNQEGFRIARCHLTGLAQLLEGAPCCSEYTGCEVWRRAKQRDWEHKRMVKAPKRARTDGSLSWS